MLDATDQKIVDALKSNSRASVRDIAKQKALRPSTVHQRIRKLVDNDVIEKFTLKLNNKSVGENFIVFMLIKGESSAYIDACFLENPHVKEVFGVTGDHDMLVKLKFRDVEDFNSFIIDFRKDKPEIRSTLTMVGTVTLKEEI